MPAVVLLEPLSYIVSPRLFMMPLCNLSLCLPCHCEYMSLVFVSMCQPYELERKIRVIASAKFTITITCRVNNSTGDGSGRQRQACPAR